jgi:hypothetical protein
MYHIVIMGLSLGARQISRQKEQKVSSHSRRDLNNKWMSAKTARPGQGRPPWKTTLLFAIPRPWLHVRSPLIRVALVDSLLRRQAIWLLALNIT